MGNNTPKRAPDAGAAQKLGQFSATTAARLLKLKTAAIQALLTPCAYYETGLGNRHTAYYDVRDLLDFAAGKVAGWSEEKARTVSDQMAQLKGYRLAKTAKAFYKANIRFMEWFGTMDHPIASPRFIAEAMVEQSGKKLTIYARGKTLVKMIGARGTRIDKFPFSELTQDQFAEWKKANGYS